MKKFFSVVSVATLIGVSAPAIAGQVDTAIRTVSAQGLQIAEHLVANNLKSAAPLIGQKIAGVVVTPQLANLANGLRAKLTAGGITLTTADFDRLEALVTAEDNKVGAEASLTAIGVAAQAGDLSDARVKTELANAAADSGALLPQYAAQIDATELLASYTPSDEEVQAILAKPAVSPEAEAARATVLKSALVDAPANCDLANPEQCTKLALENYVLWVGAEYDATGSASFVAEDVNRAFKRSGPLSQFLNGVKNAIPAIQAAKKSGQMTEQVTALNSCFIRGDVGAADTTAVAN